MLKRRSDIPGFQEGGANVDPISGNEVPTGSMPEEVRDDIDAKLSPGEFVLPADVVRFIGLERLMKMRDEAKKGLQRMSDIGQMGNADEVGEASNGTYEDAGFESEIDDILSEIEAEENGRDVNEQTEVMMAEGGVAVGTKTNQTTTAGRPVYRTAEGDNVSELSITVPFKGFWANVTSIHNGVKYDEDQIVEMLNKGKIKPTSVHESIKEAVDAAKARSAGLLDKPEMAQGGFMKSGTDLTKAPKNPVFDVRYYKNAEGSVMYITHINGKPMTPIPEGYKAVTQEEAQKVGQKAEEAAKVEKKPEQESSYEGTPGDPGTPEEQAARNQKLNDFLTGVLPAAAKAMIPGMGLMTLAQKAAGLFANQSGKPMPVEERTGVSAAAIQAQELAFNMGLSTENAARAAKAAEAAVNSGVDTNRAASEAVFNIAMEQQSRGIADELEALNASPSTTPSTASSSRSMAGAGSSFAVSPSVPATTTGVAASGSGPVSRNLDGPDPGIDRSGSYDYGGSSYGYESPSAIGADVGESYSFLAKGGLVNKRQYPSKKKRGKGIASAKT
jgi:Arc/MetJ-type ribon-helix-helix transcriptional regulator